MMIPTITLSELAGLPVYTAESGGPFIGSLTFGVGRRDESAPTAGTAHLLEHLIMHRVGKVGIAHNAATGDETISFYAQGEPARVADFLNRVAHAVSTLADLSDTDVEEQRRIIAAELGDGDERPGRGALLDRFGAQSVGLLDIGSPGHRSITRQQVVAFAETWLHAGNAALAFTGVMPEGLDVALPAAGALPHRVPATVIREGAWAVSGSIPVCISLVLDASKQRAAGSIAATIIEQGLFAELRRKKALVYSVDSFSAALGPGRRFVAYALDPRPEEVLPTAAAAVSYLRELAETGPSEEMMQEALDDWNQFLANPDAAAGLLEGQVDAVLRGRCARDDVKVPDPSGVTAAEVRSIIAEALTSLFVTFGEDGHGAESEAVSRELGLSSVEWAPSVYSTLAKPEFSKRLKSPGVESFAPRSLWSLGRARLVVDHERVACLASGSSWDVPYADTALAFYSEEHRVWGLTDMGGDLAIVDRDEWWGDGKLHRLLAERLPKDRQIIIDAVT
ncbi:MAG: insulinase family protein [Actinobacteria bacterium]|nr:insulinase family protein [Actinomycetota bacterium]